MIFYIPLSRFKITYEVAAGRPFSKLEQLVLRSVAEGTTDIGNLSETFRVHPRLLVEALVTLTQAGWIAVGAGKSQGFVLTSDGRASVSSDEPPKSLIVSSRQAYLVMERLTGALLGSSEISFVSGYTLEKHAGEGIALRAEVADNRLDEGQVQNLLPARLGEWVRWIGPIDMVSKGAHWLPISIDLASQTIVGLPEAWIGRLRPILIEIAARLAPEMTEEQQKGAWDHSTTGLARKPVDLEDPEALRLPASRWPIAIRKDDLLLTPDDHLSQIETALADARSAVLVASAFLKVEALENLKDPLLGALKRGVDLDVLWGYSTGPSTGDGDALTWLGKLAYIAKRDDFKGKLRFNRTPSHSHAKVLLWDSAQGYCASIGSFNWLSNTGLGSGKKQPGHEVSLRLRNPGPVGAICRCVAAIWSSIDSEALASTGDIWRRIASDLGMKSLSQDKGGEVASNAEVELILDGDHEVALREWARSAKRRFLVASHKLGGIADIRLAALSAEERAKEFQCHMLYGETALEQPKVDGIDAHLAKLGKLRKVLGMHSKIVVADDAACISSYNFLSSDPFGTATKSREVGLSLRGAEVATWVFDALSAL